MISGGLLLPLVCLVMTGCSKEEIEGGTPKQPYPLERCLVCDKSLGSDVVVFVHDGQEIKLCGEGCRAEFDKDPQFYRLKLPPLPPEHARP